MLSTNFPIPAGLADKDNMMSKIIHAREREENIARHRSPLTKEMYVEMARRAKKSSRNSIDAVLFDFFNLIRVGGFRVAEYAQETQTKVDEFEYASGNKVVKAFTSIDWNFYDAKGHLMTLHNLDSLGEINRELHSEYRRIEKTVKKSLSPLMTSTRTYAPFGRHIGFSFKLRDLVKTTTSQWVFI